jgi:hypothetical protein
MTYIIRCMFYSIRNLIFYRSYRVDQAAARLFLQQLKGGEFKDKSNQEQTLQELRDKLTEFVLSGVGLRIAKNPGDRMPRWVWLTQEQRQLIEDVSKYGYQVTLR